MVIHNRKAKYDYELSDKIEAGIILNGGEVKSIVKGQASLEGAYAKIIKGELYLINAHVHPYQFSDTSMVDPRRDRKLLIHKKELLALQNKMEQKRLTLIPLSFYFSKNKVKLELALGKSKKEYEKKESIKNRDLERRMEEEIKGN